MDDGGAVGLPARRLAAGERGAVGREVVRVVVHLGPKLKASSSSRGSSALGFLGLGQGRVERRKWPLG